MIQTIICLCGIITVHLLARNDKYQKFGYLVGLFSEPFWIISAWQNGQWGIGILAVYYGTQYWRGWKNHNSTTPQEGE
jgi:hypothetical protein